MASVWLFQRTGRLLSSIPLCLLLFIETAVSDPMVPIKPITATTLSQHPMITPAPNLDDRVLPERRDFNPIEYLSSKWKGLESSISSYVVSGVPEFFQGLPTGGEVLSSLGLDDSELAARPTQVLNIPGYANWTDQVWNARVHGNVYKQPDISQDHLDDLADIFLVDVDIEDLPSSQQEQARNVTASIFVVQQGDVNVTVNFQANFDVQSDASGNLISAAGGAQSLQLPYSTTTLGDFDAFVLIQNTTGPDGGYLLPGNSTSSVQALNVYANGTTDTGNATTYLVPPTGLTVVSDIDDILRVTKIYEPVQGLLNSFARPFVPWTDMPAIYANWSRSIPDLHFHYLTTTPEQVTRTYMSFIYSTYPLGSFDTRPLNFSDASATLSIRAFLLSKIFTTFPDRRFVLVGDTTNSDVMRDYPDLLRSRPDQVACVLLRNTTATDPGDLFPYDTSGFEGLDESRWMFFRTPADLVGIDISGSGGGAGCRNRSFAQNVTFGWQGRGFGNTPDEDGGGDGDGDNEGARRRVDAALLGMSVMVVCLVLLFS